MAMVEPHGVTLRHGDGFQLDLCVPHVRYLGWGTRVGDGKDDMQGRTLRLPPQMG